MTLAAMVITGQSYNEKPELQNVKCFTQIKSFEAKFTPRKIATKFTLKLNDMEIIGYFWGEKVGNAIKKLV